MSFYSLHNFFQMGASCQLPSLPPLLVLSFILTPKHTLEVLLCVKGSPALPSHQEHPPPTPAPPHPPLPAPPYTHPSAGTTVGEDHLSKLPSTIWCLP